MMEELTLLFLFCEMHFPSSSYGNAGIQWAFISKWTARSSFNWTRKRRKEFLRKKRPVWNGNRSWRLLPRQKLPLRPRRGRLELLSRRENPCQDLIVAVIVILVTREEKQQKLAGRNAGCTGTPTRAIEIRREKKSKRRSKKRGFNSRNGSSSDEYASGSEEDDSRGKKSKHRSRKEGSTSSDGSSSDEYASRLEEDQRRKKHLHRRTKRHHHSSRTDPSMPYSSSDEDN